MATSTHLIAAYLRIEQDIRILIDSGTVRAGDRIPTEDELCDRYGVAKMTVRQGLSRLVASGVLIRRRGIGTFVAAPKIERAGNRLLGFEEDARAHGVQPSTEVLAKSWVDATPDEAETLGLSPNVQVLRIDRLRRTDGEPIALNTILLPPVIGRLLEHLDFGRSLYALTAEALGQPVAYADQRVEAVTADRDQAALLGVAYGAALLRVQRITHLSDGRLLGLTRSHYRGDRYFIALRIER
ncbi:MAG: GntR family transcriptional regulator [bacterium]|nr:GntR family transcriptional regulator [bacterium]